MSTKLVSAQHRAILLMLLCGIMWSTGGIFIKLIPWHALVISGWRSLLSALCMWLFMRHSKLAFRFNRYSLIGGVSLALTLIAFVFSNKLTTAANAIVLQFTNPIFILIISAVVFRQRISRLDLSVVVMTMFGISLFFFDQISPSGMLGNLIALSAGVMVAIMYVSTGAADEESRMSGILLGHLFCMLVGVPFTFILDTPATPVALISVVVLGIFQLGIPYILFGIAVRDCPPLMCSLIAAVEPLLNPVWVFFFTGERPGLFALIGGVIVISSIILWCVRRTKYAS